MKEKRKLSTLFLFVSIFCICTFVWKLDAQAATQGTIPCSEGSVIWTLDENGVLTISGNGITDIKGESNQDDWGDYWKDTELAKTDVLSVEVEQNSQIELDTCKEMFAQFNNCTDIDITGLDTGNVTSMENMFSYCKLLTELDVTGLDTSKVTNMYMMFGGCNKLAELDVTGFDTSQVTTMAYMFGNCNALTSLNLTGFNTSNVTTMGGMFQNCSSLTALNLTNFNTSNVTTMGGMFQNCSSLTALNLTNFDTSNVTNMSSMFYGCSQLRELDLSSFDTSQVINMNVMFSECGNLKRLNIASFNTSNVTDMGGMFSGCIQLAKLDVSNFNTSNVKNMSSMFKSCRIIKELDVSGFDTRNVTDTSWMFLNCYKVAQLDVTGFDTSKVKSMAGMFSKCRKLDNLDVSGFDTSKVKSMRHMFFDCNALSTLNVTNFDTSNVTDMGSMFNSCFMLKELDVTGFDTSKVTSMVCMFYKCNLLNKLDVKNFDTSNVTNMNNMFGGLELLTALDVTNFDTSKVTEMSYMFTDCKLLKQLDLSSFDISNGTVMEDIILNCESLNKFVTPKTEVTIMLPSLFDNKIWVDSNHNIYSAAEYTFEKSTELHGTNTNYNIYYETQATLVNCPSTYSVLTGLSNLGTANMEHYTFSGWYTDKACTKPITEIERGTFGDLTLYAKMNPLEYQIIYKNIEDVLNKQTLPLKYTYGINIVLPQVERSCYEFKGWYTDETMTNQINAISNTASGDITLYAKWEVSNTTDKDEETITNTANDADVKGSSFAKIQARADKTTKNSIRLTWNKVKEADGYFIYGNKCNRKNKFLPIKTIANNKKTSYTLKKLEKGTYYKYIVRAYKLVDGKKKSIAVSKTIHATTTGGKNGNAKAVKVNKTKITLKSNKTFKIKASEIKQSKKISRHRDIAFESSNKKIATVSKKGVIKGKKKGTCYVYAYAQNGVYKRIKVTVK